MKIREALTMCQRLNVPIDLVLTEEVELRFAEQIPGMGGKLHVTEVPDPDLDPKPVPCGAHFESSDPDAGPCTPTRLLSLMESSRLCTVCLDKLGVVNVTLLSLVDQVADRIVQHAEMVEGLVSVETEEPGKADPVMIGYVASGQQRLDRLVEDAKLVEGYDVIAVQVASAQERAGKAFEELVEVVRKRPVLDDATREVLEAIEADSARTSGVKAE